jgi:adenylate kinase family enzyme
MKHSKRQTKGKREMVIILGPPGSGKGTQGELLAEKFNLYYLETSKILENEFEKAKKGQSIRFQMKRNYGRMEFYVLLPLFLI